MRIRIDLGYDGSSFHGWAKQPHLRTVQGELEHALHMVLHVPLDDDTERLRLTVAGRTDTGVHARMQVCHCDLQPETLDSCIGHLGVTGVEALRYRLAHIVPHDIVIRDVSIAPPGFDARFSALDRSYVYRICDTPDAMDPRLRGMVLCLDGSLDLAAMNNAASLIPGLRDFGSFSTPNPNGTTIRRVTYAQWRRYTDIAACDTQVPGALEAGLVHFTITADAFAHNMVRSLVNACVQVGEHRRTLAWFRRKLASPEREGDTGPIAAHGLTLEHVSYPPDEQLAARAQSIRAKRTL